MAMKCLQNPQCTIFAQVNDSFSIKARLEAECLKSSNTVSNKCGVPAIGVAIQCIMNRCNQLSMTYEWSHVLATYSYNNSFNDSELHV